MSEYRITIQGVNRPEMKRRIETPPNASFPVEMRAVRDALTETANDAAAAWGEHAYASIHVAFAARDESEISLCNACDIHERFGMIYDLMTALRAAVRSERKGE